MIYPNTGKTWTEADKALLRRAYPDPEVDVSDLSNDLGRDPQHIRVKAWSLGLRRGRKKFAIQPKRAPATAPKPRPLPETPKHPYWTPQRDLKVWATEGRYQAISELAKELKRPQQFVLARWHRLNAEGCWMTSLLPPEINEMKLRRNALKRMLLVAHWRNDDPALFLQIRRLRRLTSYRGLDLQDAKRVIWSFLSMDEINRIRTGAPVSKKRFT